MNRQIWKGERFSTKKAVIFDMDGLIIDTENYWEIVEKKVFSTVGISLTAQNCKETIGFKLDETIAYWYRKQPWANRTFEEVKHDIKTQMIQCHMRHTNVKSGVNELLQIFKGQSHLKMAVCSSSPLWLIEAILQRVELIDYFDLLHSAIEDKHDKPHPQPYINCAENLNVLPSECVVFEDSIRGSIAAKSAGMMVIAVPEGKYDKNNFTHCDIVVEKIDEFLC